MGRKVVFSAMILAGLVQTAPAVAQIEDRQDDWGRSPALSAPAPVAAGQRSADPMPVAEEQPDPAPAASPAIEARSSARAERVAEVKAREPDLADKDLAIVPPEEARPIVIDPTAARRAMASATRRAPPMQDNVGPAPEPALAAVRRAPEPARAEQDRDTAPAAAGDVAAAPIRPLPEYRDARPGRGGQYREPAPTRAEHAAQTGPNEREQYRRAADVAMERATPTDPDQVADRQPVTEDRPFARRPIYAGQDDDQPLARIEEQAPPPFPTRRPTYADGRDRFPAAEATGPGYDDRDSAPVYAQDDRQAPTGYPRDGRTPLRGYDDRDLSADEGYASTDRDDREPSVRDASYGQAWGDRRDATACGGDRADRLQQRLRRDIADRRIDWNTARDLEAEIGHAEEMQRSYCASGLNAWREERLDRQYAQIEDRLRYEESRGGWR